MLRTYQSIYVTSYRWIFRNFGQGKLPQFKSLFNVSFLLIITLTCGLLVMQWMLRSQQFVANDFTDISILLATAFFLFMNYLILLNNRWLKKINQRMAILNRHNLNTWSILILVNVIVVCALLIFTAK